MLKIDTKPDSPVIVIGIVWISSYFNFSFKDLCHLASIIFICLASLLICGLKVKGRDPWPSGMCQISIFGVSKYFFAFRANSIDFRA